MIETTDEWESVATDVRARAASWVGATEPQRLDAFCVATQVLTQAERDVVALALGVGVWPPGAALRACPARGTSRPDLALADADARLIFSVIDGKSRSLAAENGRLLPEDPPSSLVDRAWVWDKDGTARVSQFDFYRLMHHAWMRHGWRLAADVSWVLATPGAAYDADGWDAVDLEAVYDLLGRFHAANPREEIAEAIAAWIAPPATFMWRKAGGRPRKYLWGFSVPGWINRGGCTVTHEDLPGSARLTRRLGWTLDRDAAQERAAWAAALAAEGERLRGEPCLAACGQDRCRHVDRDGVVTSDR